MGQSQVESLASRTKHRRVWRWIGVSLLAVLMAVVVVGSVMVNRVQPILRARITDSLRARFKGRVELGQLDVSLLRGLEVSGGNLRIYSPGTLVARDGQPIIAIKHFSFHSGLAGLFAKPMHVAVVRVVGLQINIPPGEARKTSAEPSEHDKGQIRIVVDEISCDNSQLIIETSNPGKDPKRFELRRIDLHDVGPNAPWKYDATLTNAIPRGDIHAVGTFGPWRTESPGDSSVTGRYTFDHADLNTIKAIGGVLSSLGNFQGTTETLNFSLDTAGHAMPLHTQFQATVDGTSGDTYLTAANAKLGNSTFTAKGTVIDIKGQGHHIDIDIDVADAPVQDFLELAVKTEPAVITGEIHMIAKLRIPPGKESASQKLRLTGTFALTDTRFSNRSVQDKVDMLSLRAQGRPKAAKAGAMRVNSQMKGRFQMQEGVIQFSDLAYLLPGARVNLEGLYSLDGQRYDFHGNVLTDASLSEMVDSRWASLALKAISPFFRRNGGGADIPVSISGTKSEPKFGLDVLKKHQPHE
jgi:hypothetical protein